jgi:hypothetical protein
MVTEGIEPSTVALLAQRSNQLSYATSLLSPHILPTYLPCANLYSTNCLAILMTSSIHDLYYSGIFYID